MPSFLDSLAIFIIILMGYSGFTKGFIEEFGRLLSLVLAALISISNSIPLSGYLSNFLKYDGAFLLPLSYAILVVLSMWIGRMVTKFLHIAFLSVENRLMNHTMGFFFGIIKGATLLIILVWFISILPLQKWTNIINKNSKLITYSNQVRTSVISFFNLEDPISLSEYYIREITQH